MVVNDTFVVNAVKEWLPKRYKTSSGWENFNCVMCQHNGEPTPDNKKKGNVIFSGPSFTYRCWRCKYKAHWRPGFYVGGKVERLFKALGMPEELLAELKFNAVQLKELADVVTFTSDNEVNLPDFEEMKLPEKSDTIFNWLEKGGEIPETNQFVEVASYLMNRGERFHNYMNKIYWTPERKNQLAQRFIIPYYYCGKIVGYTARLIYDNAKDIPKYYTQVSNENFLFNNYILDDYHRQYVVIVEGPMDALAINAVAICGSEISEEQIKWINSTDAKKILLPDRDAAGMHTIEIAIEQGWHVSFPDWDKNITDASKATKEYGAVWTTRSILESIVIPEAKIRQLAKIYFDV